MFIPHQFDRFNEFHPSAFIVVYIPPNATNDHNHASMCVWIVPGTQVED